MTMALLRLPLLLTLTLTLTLTLAATAFNITEILQAFPELAQFNNLLSESKVADDINSRSTATVLAVEGGGLERLSGLPADTVKKILSVHVILNFFNETKVQKIAMPSITLTTLYQDSGVDADGNQRRGFVNLVKTDEGVAFGSAVPGSPMDSVLKKYVFSQPDNVSVIQVSSVIVPPGMGPDADAAAQGPAADADADAAAQGPGPAASSVVRGMKLAVSPPTPAGTPSPPAKEDEDDSDDDEAPSPAPAAAVAGPAADNDDAVEEESAVARQVVVGGGLGMVVMAGALLGL